MTRRLLLTGFEPFDGATRNPSGEIAQRLNRVEVGDARIDGFVLPVTRDGVLAPLREYFAETAPDAILALGVAATRSVISVERVAINIDDYTRPDNAGVQPFGEQIISGGQDGLFSSVPVRSLTAAIRTAGVPADVSNSAGSYLCNHLYYRLLMHARKASPERRPLVVFLHIPQLPEELAQTGVVGPSMSLETSERGVRAAIGHLLELTHAADSSAQVVAKNSAFPEA